MCTVTVLCGDDFPPTVFLRYIVFAGSVDKPLKCLRRRNADCGRPLILTFKFLSDGKEKSAEPMEIKDIWSLSNDFDAVGPTVL